MVSYDLPSIWTVLAEAPIPDGRSLTVSPALTLADGREVLAGIDVLGNRHVLVPLLAAEQFGDAGQGKPLQLRAVQLPEGRYASTVCTDRRLDDVFSQFSRELVESVIASGKPGRDMRIAFGRWRALFSETPGPRLNKLEEIGLLGELLALRSLLGAGGSVVSWEGPTKSMHDFQSRDCHVEVKSTLAREGLRVTIHGVEQLDAANSEALYLLVYRLEESISGESLVDLIRDIEATVDDLMLFEGRLRQAGFEWHQAASYETRYSPSQVLCFDVLQPSFPRIVPSSFTGSIIPPGTLQLSYVADLTGPFPEPLPDSGLEAIFLALAEQ